MADSTVPYDSMYEMDAPQLVDFDATNLSVNESIFDKQTVGEKKHLPFRDIGNVTPAINRVHKNSGTGKSPRRTPNNWTPLAIESSGRRITRSASRKLECTLTPVAHTASPALANVDVEQQSSVPESMETVQVCSSEEDNLTYPKPVTHNPPSSNTVVSSKKKSLKTRASTESLDIAENDHSGSGFSAQHKSEATTRSASKGKLQMKPAHSGTPFNGKHSPLKTLRARTRSMESAQSGSHAGAARKESNSTTTRQSVRHRTASAGTNVKSEEATSQFQPKMNTRVRSTGISPTFSRLMKPTESAKHKMHDGKPGPSPSKRKISSSSESKPPKVLKSTIPRSPSFSRHSRSRLTPAKSSEDLEMERIQKEKEELSSLKKKNQEGLKSLMSSTGKREKPSGLPTGKSADANAKVKRNIYHVVQPAEDSGKPKQFDPPGRASRRDAYNMRPRLTKPVSPVLHSKSRERAAPARTEDMELEMMKQAQFKAAPLNKRVLEGQTGVKFATRQRLTEPLPVKFATDDRLAKHAEKHVGPVTPEPQPIIKALPPPEPKPVFKPKLDHKATNVEPFTFENKDEAAKQRKAELLRKVEEKERKLREFKANPLPPTPTPLPSKQVAPVTKPEPFHLMIDERGQQQQEKLKRKLEEENARMRQAAKVHAKPADVLKKAPFVPKKEPAKVTEPLPIELTSAKRAEERKEFELRKMQNEMRVRELEEQQKQRKAAVERQEIKRLRQETVIKQGPIKHYKPVQIQRSEKPLTMPMSPRFSKK